MHKIVSNKIKKYAFILICILLLVFCVLKVLRGTDTSTATFGGIWNYISLLYYPLIFLALLYKPHRFRSVFVLPFLYVAFAFIATIINLKPTLSITEIYDILMIPYFLLVLSVFYNYSFDCKIGKKIILLSFIICLSINMWSILKYQLGDAPRPLASDIYFSLALFPFVQMLLKNRTLRFIFTLGMFIAIFFSGKRTGLIAFLIAIIIYIVINEWQKNPNATIKIIKILILTTCVLIAIYYITSFLDSKYDLGIFYRMKNLMEDGGSGRNEIYKNVWKEFCNSSLLEQLFGHGSRATGNITAALAHNDFLEILYDYGVFAALCIVFFYIILLKMAYRMIKNGSPYAPAFCSSLAIALLLSMFSFFLFYYTYVTGMAAFWGFCLAMEKHRILKLKEYKNEL